MPSIFGINCCDIVSIEIGLLGGKDEDEFDLTRDWIMVFAPVKLKPYENVKISELTYVRVSPKGNITLGHNLGSNLMTKKGKNWSGEYII